MLRSFIRSFAVVGGVLSFAACSDPVSPAADEIALPSFDLGVTADVGPVVLTYKSGADATEFCSKTADNTFSNAVGSCAASIVAPITTINPGWTATLAGAQWISHVSNGDAYLSPSASYTYRKQFSVPSGVTNPVLNLEMAADNGVTVYLNGNLVGASPVDQNIFAATQKFSASTGFNIGGTNDLVFVVTNTRVPAGGGDVPTPVDQACPDRPHAQNTAGTGPFYDAGDYDAVQCYNPTGMLYGVTVSWVVPQQQTGGQGCSPGYWKNHNAPAGYNKSALFGSVFENAFPGMTMQQVLSQGGGGIKALGRHTVSAYYNALALGANYELTPAQVIAKFNAANPNGNINGLIAELEALQDVNGRVCPNPTGR